MAKKCYTLANFFAQDGFCHVFILFSGVETRAGLGGVVPVSSDPGYVVGAGMLSDELPQGCFLGLSPGVRWTSLVVDTSDVSNADAVGIVSAAMCSGLR